MLRRSRLLAVALSIAVAIAALAAQRPVEPRIRRIEREARLTDRMRELRIPAVSMAVFHDGRLEWLRAWGMADVAARRRADPDTRFQAASISKPVAAAAALALVSRGRLSLDANINDHLRSWKLPDNEFTAKQPVTLAHLLTHSAGVTVHGFRGYAKGEDVPTLVELLDGAAPANSAAVRVNIPVGSKFRYAGGGYEIVQLAIEDETRKPFAQAARELVLEPFGMRRSTFLQPIPADLRAKAATGYRANGDPVAGNWHVYPEQAAAGLWTTPEDLARFALELHRIATRKVEKVMSHELAWRMLQRQFDRYGLGFVVTGDGPDARFSHGGSNEGFRCHLLAYRETGSGVAIMTNSDNGGALAQELVRAVGREYQWGGLEPRSTPRMAKLQLPNR
jgi:CubicO group peptidase (beta-lactamase class C family)